MKKHQPRKAKGLKRPFTRYLTTLANAAANPWRRMMGRFYERVRNLGVSKETAVRMFRAERSKTNNAAQWHRWYKANRRYQRQLSALKQYGVKIAPKSTGLRREMVP